MAVGESVTLRMTRLTSLPLPLSFSRFLPLFPISINCPSPFPVCITVTLFPFSACYINFQLNLKLIFKTNNYIPNEKLDKMLTTILQRIDDSHLVFASCPLLLFSSARLLLSSAPLVRYSRRLLSFPLARCRKLVSILI